MNSLVLFVNRGDVLQAVFLVYTNASRRAQTFACVVGYSDENLAQFIVTVAYVTVK